MSCCFKCLCRKRLRSFCPIVASSMRSLMSHETPWDSFQPSQGTELLTHSPPIPSKCWSSCFQLFLSIFPFLLPHPLKLFDLKCQEHPTHFSSHLPSLLPLPSTLPACCLQLHKSADNIFPLVIAGPRIVD